MTRLKYLLIGALAVTATGAIAAGPIILGAQPFPTGCTAITNTALSTTSENVLADTPDRKEWCIANGDDAIAIHVAQHATATTADVRVGPGQTICSESNKGGFAHTGVVDAIAASGTPAISGYSCR